MGGGDAAVVEGDLERDAAAVAVAAGEDGAVVGEEAGRVAEGVGGVAKGALDVGGFEDPSGGAGEAEPRVVIDQVEDLDVGAVREGSVGDVALPAFVGLDGFEADVGALGSLVGLGSDEPAVGEDPPDRRGRRAGAVAALEMERDRGRAGLMAGSCQVLAELDDLVLNRDRGALGRALRPA